MLSEDDKALTGVITRYGKRSRTQLTDAELVDFIDYLKLQPRV